MTQRQRRATRLKSCLAETLSLPKYITTWTTWLTSLISAPCMITLAP